MNSSNPTQEQVPLAECVDCLPVDRGSILGLVIPKTQKMVPDASLLNTQRYKIRIKAKVEQRPSLHHGVVAIEKGAFRSPSIMVTNFTFTFMVPSMSQINLFANYLYYKRVLQIVQIN